MGQLLQNEKFGTGQISAAALITKRIYILCSVDVATVPAQQCPSHTTEPEAGHLDAQSIKISTSIL